MIGAGLAWADQAGVAPQAKKPVQAGFELQCQPFGAAEFVNDVQIWNKGTKPVPSGTKVHWEVMNGQWKGNYTFAASLAPGAKVVLNNVMNGAQSQGNCTVKVVETLHLDASRISRLPLMRLKTAPDSRFKINAAAARVLQTAPQGLDQDRDLLRRFLYPPPPQSQWSSATSRDVFWVNTTNAVIPAGTPIEIEVDGTPYFKRIFIQDFALPPNPPATTFGYWVEFMPVPQHFTRPCRRAWAHLP